MNVTYRPVLPIPCSSASSCSPFARNANGRPPSLTGRCVLSSTPLGFNSSLFQLAYRRRRHVCSQKLLLVGTRRSAFHLHGDRRPLQKTFASAKEDRDSKFGVSGEPHGVDIWVSQKEEDKTSCVEARDFWSSATEHTASEPLRQRKPFSPPQTFPTNSNLTRKQQTRVVNPSAASRLQNRLPAFKQAAEPDAFGASFSPLHGADAFSSCNGQGPGTSGPLTQKFSCEECNSPKESVFASKLEEILNKFRTRQKRSSFRDEPYDVGWRNRVAPSAPQSDTITNERLQARRINAARSQADGDQRKIRGDARNPRRKGSVSETSVNENEFNEEELLFSTACHQGDSVRERRLGTTKGNGVGLYNAENSIPNLVEGSTPLQWERQGVHSPVSKLQTSIRKGNSNLVDVHAIKSSQSVMFDKNRRHPGLDSHDDGHWSTRVEKQRETGKVEHHPGAKVNVVSEFHWTDSDEENSFDTDTSITPDDGASSTHGRKDDQPSPDSSMGVKTSKFRTIMNGQIATWHSHPYPNLPFEFEYSYSENPKAPIVRYREEPYSPFGPDTMGRPWTGCAPLKKSRKKLPEFDSFNPPPAKKGIKFVQSPGPFPEGRGPGPTRSREEVLGAPLTVEEIVDLVDKCRSEKRQLNLGRDGVTHNMLNLIHCHWKRRRVVKVKCIGVPTLDMDNVCFHLEDKTGGKIIYRSGGVVYLFRGRNYNYKHRPVIPIMLWKPISPVYPRLIKRAPEGLTYEEADKLRLMGQKVEPLCTLAKNGVYLSLVKDVRAAFKVDDLVRINCRGLNPSDYKKIGAKLRDLVPCVLLSFDDEQILMWRGKETVSANVDADTSNRMEAANGSAVEAAKPPGACIVGDDESNSAMGEMEQRALVIDSMSASMGSSNCSIAAGAEGHSDHSTGVETIDQTSVPSTLRTVLDDNAGPIPEYTMPNDKTFDIVPEHETENNRASDCQFSESRRLMESNSLSNDQKDEETVPKMALNLIQLESSGDIGTGWKSLSIAPVVGVDALWDQAIASGIAIQLDEIETDSDVIAKKAVELHKTVPAVAEYTRKLLSKLWIKKKTTPRPDDDLRILFKNLSKLKNEQKAAKRGSRSSAIAVPDSGGLPMDELARILSIK